MATLKTMKVGFDRSQSTPLDTTNYDKGVLLAQKIVELRDLEKEKAETVAGYNEQIKALEASIQEIAGEIKSGQVNLFDGKEGKYPEGKEQ